MSKLLMDVSRLRQELWFLIRCRDDRPLEPVDRGKGLPFEFSGSTWQLATKLGLGHVLSL
jgi:hypothetical protein